ncbi:hypothetical protein F5879DRAFT_987128 [Lentinula edodes]|uniref:uncharacterized protein n=1 Tax=Lentinula edodes TaxID=5353 RepID=UPI001E8D03CE|nr:uncharacterized protein C8R40DRAFT_1070658 [Lentinula edodes]KAH7873808.1 hypothetical protein C8R40DRAFT_1070658 [Lentinula edodes]KAJ3906684.1 hypothetical protein F5879DRAFT_987128 [Lentinula edodes]
MKLSVQPIIYVFLGSVISAVHAVPVVVHTPGATTPGPHLETRASSKDIINIAFHNPSAQRGTGTPVSKIKTEIKTILTKWRESDHVSKKPKDAKNFDLEYDNRYDDNIHLNLHEFSFWGKGVGEGCKEEEDGCYVQYEQDEYSELGAEVQRHPDAAMGYVYRGQTVLLELGYKLRG